MGRSIAPQWLKVPPLGVMTECAWEGCSHNCGEAADEALQPVDPLSPHAGHQQQSHTDENCPADSGDGGVVLFDPLHATSASDEEQSDERERNPETEAVAQRQDGAPDHGVGSCRPEARG